MRLLFPLMPKKVPVALRCNDVLMTSGFMKIWILWILDEKRPNFKFSPKILGISSFDGVFLLIVKGND